mgnify:CR=1 FL=1
MINPDHIHVATDENMRIHAYIHWPEEQIFHIYRNINGRICYPNFVIFHRW